jgi:hypothetical protein
VTATVQVTQCLAEAACVFEGRAGRIVELQQLYAVNAGSFDRATYYEALCTKGGPPGLTLRTRLTTVTRTGLQASPNALRRDRLCPAQGTRATCAARAPRASGRHGRTHAPSGCCSPD